MKKIKVKKFIKIKSNEDDEIIAYNDNNGIKVKMLILGIKFKDNIYKEVNHTHNCWWCRHKINDIPLPLPVRMEYKNKDNIYHGDGFFCSFECAYSFIKDHDEKIIYKRDLKYKDSMKLLLSLYNKLYNKPLKYANDWRLLKNIGYGEQTIEDFRKNSHSFYITNNITLYPIKTIYSIK